MILLNLIGKKDKIQFQKNANLLVKRKIKSKNKNLGTVPNEKII